MLIREITLHNLGSGIYAVKFIFNAHLDMKNDYYRIYAQVVRIHLWECIAFDKELIHP